MLLSYYALRNKRYANNTLYLNIFFFFRKTEELPSIAQGQAPELTANNGAGIQPQNGHVAESKRCHGKKKVSAVSALLREECFFPFGGGGGGGVRPGDTQTYLRHYRD